MSIHAAYSDTMKQRRKKNNANKKMSVRQWIAITEQKPESNTPVLFIASSLDEQSSGYIHEGMYHHDLGQFETLHTFLKGRYWIPLSVLPAQPENTGGESHV
jgi:hypothetical protein